MTSVNLSLRLLRVGGRRGLLAVGLTAGAVAVCTALLLAAVAANVAFAGRADRDAWRHPGHAAAPGKAVALEGTSLDYVRGQVVTVVDLAALRETGGTGALPAPPGMARFPAPGEVWMSPALARLVSSLPPGQLADRFPARTPTGLLGADALVHGGELVAVVGRHANDPAMHGDRSDLADATSPAPIASFTDGRPNYAAGFYRILTGLATVLLGVPLLVFGGAAARLTVARRDQRLAALRLVGATPGQVVAMTVAESMVTALAGALAGSLLYVAMIPGLTRISISGGTWAAGDLWVGVQLILAVVAAVVVLVGVSAVAGLRRVVVSPLGVARRQTPPGLRAVRVIAFVAAVLGFLFASKLLQGSVATVFTVIVVMLAVGFWTLNLVGPWVVGLIGRIAAAGARRPARLLAGRRLMDDPRAAWRTVNGIALTGFVAGFTVLLNPGPGGLGHSTDQQLRARVPAQHATAVVADARERLAGIPAARVRLTEPEGAGKSAPSYRSVVVKVPGGQERTDEARTALAGLVPGRPFAGPADADRGGEQMLADIQTGSRTVLFASFLLGTVSAGISGVSSILDRRQTFALLRLAGTPLRVLDAARRRETLIPLVVMGGGALVTGLVMAAPFALANPVRPEGLVTLALTVLGGLGAVIGASELSRPFLRAVTTDPAPRPD
ncbi:FtsX-like permease family protein [Actinopolymorpha sp. NPDC004070]|uniref:FtsX-like permease family protein n=1 Tax=Actinopolymorpha sp. NPDC004070 TaxID=3154548 RepID=UPI0033B72704